MIPHTFPSVLTTSQLSQMTVATITPTTAQIAWLDYIPVVALVVALSAFIFNLYQLPVLQMHLKGLAQAAFAISLEY